MRWSTFPIFKLYIYLNSVYTHKTTKVKLHPICEWWFISYCESTLGVPLHIQDKCMSEGSIR